MAHVGQKFGLLARGVFRLLLGLPQALVVFLQRAVGQRQLAGVQPRSMLYAPLIIGDRVVGLLSVQSVAPDSYQRVHLDMLQMLAAHAAAGLENARAYQQLEDALAALRQTQRQLMLQDKQVRLHTG